jgi:RHS repeat-associated protein
MNEDSKNLTPIDPTKFGMLSQQTATTPTLAESYRMGRTLPSNINPSPTNEHDLITEQTRALKDDLQIIFQYVHNNIKFTPTYGLQKGGLGALIDGSGNAFDQADLMVRLLTQAKDAQGAPKYTANYVRGCILLDASQLFGWLGTTNLTRASELLANGGIGNEISGSLLKLEHCWVQVTSGTNTYVFDPAFKQHNDVSAIATLATSLGYDQATFLAAAKQGSTPTPATDYVQNINDGNIQTQINTLYAQLITYIENNMPGASLAQILGGRSIVPIETSVEQSDLSYRDTNYTMTISNTVDNKCKSILQVQYDHTGSHYTIDVAFFSADIYEKRLTLWFVDDQQDPEYLMAKLRLDGTALDTSSQQTAGNETDIVLTASHAYADSFADAVQQLPVRTGAQTAIGSAWGTASPDMAQLHQIAQNEAIALNTLAGAENMLGQSLLLIWDNFIGQGCKALDLLSRMSKCEIVLHHFVGTISQQTFGANRRNVLNSFLGCWSGSALNDDAVEIPALRTASSMVMHTMEGVAHQQVTGVNCAGPMRIIRTANSGTKDANGNSNNDQRKIYLGTSANWAGSVKPVMQNPNNPPVTPPPVAYTTTTLGEIESEFINRTPSWNVLLAADADIEVEGFDDQSDVLYAYLGISSDGNIVGKNWLNSKGSVSSGNQDDTATNSAASDNARQANGFGMPSVTASESARVNMLNGRYEYSCTDMTVGNQGAPYELSFTRSYNSALRLTHQGLGFGWCHNWQMKASENSDGYMGLGEHSVIAGAPAIAALFVTLDIARAGLAVDNMVILCIVQDILALHLVNNVVRLQTGGGTAIFTKMPDGAYLPPGGTKTAALLTKNLGQSSNEDDDYFVYTTPDKVKYTYLPTGELDKIEYPFGITIALTYEGQNMRLVKVSNGFRELNFTYDVYNILMSVNDGKGRTVQITVDANTLNLTSVSDPLPVSNTNYEYVTSKRGLLKKITKSANPTSPVVTNEHDSFYRVKQQTDAYGNVWKFYLAGSRSEEVAPNGVRRILYFNSKGSTVHSKNVADGVDPIAGPVVEYDGLQRPIRITQPEGNSTSMVYHANGDVLSTTEHAKPGSSLQDRTTSFSYGDTNWPTKPTLITDAADAMILTAYHATHGKPISVKQLKPTDDPEDPPADAPETTYVYNDKGQVTEIHVKTAHNPTPTHLKTVNAYNPTSCNLVSAAMDPDGVNVVTLFQYDDEHSPDELPEVDRPPTPAHKIGNLLKVTDPKGNVSLAEYDANRRVTHTRGPGPFHQETFITYDDNGNVIETRSLTSTDVNTQVTQTTYTIDSKVETVIGPDNFPQGSQPVPVRYVYDELRRLKSATDPQGHVVTPIYDIISRTIGSAVDGVTQQSVAYTLNGKIASVTDARNKTTTFQYDDFDRPTKIIHPDSSVEEISEYDERDNVKKSKTRAGHEYNFAYDEFGRLASKTPPDGSGLPIASFTYDLASRPETISTPIVSDDPSTGTFTMSYDSVGRMTKETYQRGQDETRVVEASVLDKHGNVLQLKYPDGSIVTNTFDQLDRLTSISGFGASTSFAYDSASRRMSQLNGNGTGQGYFFDKVDSLLAMCIGGLKPNSSLGTPPQVQLAYSLSDLAQNVSKRCNDANFLWQPTGEENRTFVYTQANDINQYPSVDGVPFTYNSNGCLTNDGVNTYAYDIESRLVSVTNSGGIVSFKYDPLGRLVEKTVGSNKVRYLYSGMQRIEEYTNGTLSRRYVWGAALDECLFVVDEPSDTLTYLHADETGSTILITDSTGTPIQRNAYTPWGELASGSLSNISVGFTGQFYIPETDLYFFKARFYSPKLGRFLQPDPIGYEGGPNLYEYCGNDPINFSDPMGLWSPADGPLQGFISNDPFPLGKLIGDFGDAITQTMRLIQGLKSLFGGPNISSFESQFNQFISMMNELTKGQAAYAQATTHSSPVGTESASQHILQNGSVSLTADPLVGPSYSDFDPYAAAKHLNIDIKAERRYAHSMNTPSTLWKFRPGGHFDFKHKFTPGTADYQLATDLANWFYGDYMVDIGWPYAVAKAGAGGVQIITSTTSHIEKWVGKPFHHYRKATHLGSWQDWLDGPRDSKIVDIGYGK